MTVVRRATVTILALLAIAAGGAGAVRGASPSPDTVGGRLAAVGDTVTVTAQGSLPVHVTLTADVVRLSVEAFDLQPGEARSLTFTGNPVGRVYATFAVLSSGLAAADSNSLTLSVGLKPYVPPFDPTPWGVGGLIALALIAGVRRLRLYDLRITRKGAHA